MAGLFDDDDERGLLIRLMEGDSQAFEALYHRHKRRIFYNLLKLVRSREVAEELHQEVFLRVWEHRMWIDPERPLGAYLARIARNLAVDFYRRAATDEKLRGQLLAEADLSYGRAQSEEMAEKPDRSERLHERLWQAIEKLPPQRQRVFTLCKLEGKSYRNIAVLLGVSVGTIKDHMAKASRFLRQELNGMDFLLATILVIRYFL